MRRLLEGSAYFNLDTQRCSAYYRAALIWGPALIRGNTVCVKNRHWQSNGIIVFLCKYYIVISNTLIGSFFYVFFLLLAALLLELHEKPRRKMYIDKFVSGTSLFWLYALLSMSFLLLSLSTPSSFPNVVLAKWPL